MTFQADKERAERQREYMAQLEREASFESSEPTSISNSSTQEGELTIQGAKDNSEVQVETPGKEEEDGDDDDDRTLATTPEHELDTAQKQPSTEFTTESMELLKQKLEEVI